MKGGNHSQRPISTRLAVLCGFACSLGIFGIYLLIRYGWALVSALA